MESFIYLGDTARLPYGTKSANTIKLYAAQMAKCLVQRHIKALVIACNTATTAALMYLQELFPDLPVIGVVAPGAAAAVAATVNQEIAVLATETTIASEAYQKIIQRHLPKVKIHSRACSVLVALAEEGMVDNAVAKEALQHYLSGIGSEDTILLGCTHFPVFKPLLQTLLPAHMRLNDADLCHSKTDNPGYVRYLVTDSVLRFQKVGEIFLQQPLAADTIELIDGY